jgi:hypothetical protein
MDEVGTLGHQAKDVTVSGAIGSGSEMETRDSRRRIMRQCEIGERNKDRRYFFEPIKIIKSEKGLLIR